MIKIPKFIYWGTENFSTLTQKRKILNTNISVVIAFVSTIMYITLYTMTGNEALIKASLSFVPFFFIYISILFLNKNGHHYIAPLFFSVSLILLVYVSMLTGQGNTINVHYYFILFGLVPFIFFHVKHIGVILLLFIINIVSFFIADEGLIIADPVIYQLNSTLILIFKYAYISITLSTLLFIIWLSEYISFENENKLQIEKQKALEASEAKAIFLANMSHEIRTPMNGIIGLNHILSKTNLDKKQSQLVEKINFSTEYLLNIVNDILDISKIEAKKLKLESIEFDLYKTIQNITAIIEPLIKDKKLSLKVNYDEKLNKIFYGDNFRISQVLTNLLNNSIKFTNNGSIELNVSQQSENRVLFEVKDTGIGIKDEYLDTIFKPFLQSDVSITREYGGTGLGLSICKDIVSLMNGKIWCESIYNSGSSFFFDIELVSSSNKTIAKNSKNIEMEVLKHTKILLVEDNSINQNVICGLLDKIDIDIANNGKEAVDLFEIDKYDLILMDIYMPQMDGYNATQIIRKQDANVPIIALSANILEDDFLKIKEVGMNEYLYKPIEADKLTNVLNQYLSQNIEIVQIDKKEFCGYIYLDIKEGLENTYDNQELYENNLKNFAKIYRDFDIDKNELEIAIHTLKGLSKQIGAKKLYKAIQKYYDDNIKEVEPIFYQLKMVINEIDTIIIDTKKIENKKTKQISLIEQTKLFLNLKEALESNEPSRCNNAIEEIQKYELDTKYDLIFNDIKDYVSNYMYYKAIKLLENNH